VQNEDLIDYIRRFFANEDCKVHVDAELIDVATFNDSFIRQIPTGKVIITIEGYPDGK
jgi:hypothetical protein